MDSFLVMVEQLLVIPCLENDQVVRRTQLGQVYQWFLDQLPMARTEIASSVDQVSCCLRVLQLFQKDREMKLMVTNSRGEIFFYAASAKTNLNCSLKYSESYTCCNRTDCALLRYAFISDGLDSLLQDLLILLANLVDECPENLDTLLDHEEATKNLLSLKFCMPNEQEDCDSFGQAVQYQLQIAGRCISADKTMGKHIAQTFSYYLNMDILQKTWLNKVGRVWMNKNLYHVIDRPTPNGRVPLNLSERDDPPEDRRLRLQISRKDRRRH